MYVAGLQLRPYIVLECLNANMGRYIRGGLGGGGRSSSSSSYGLKIALL